MFEKLARRWMMFRLRHTSLRMVGKAEDGVYSIIVHTPKFVQRYLDKRGLELPTKVNQNV